MVKYKHTYYINQSWKKSTKHPVFLVHLNSFWLSGYKKMENNNLAINYFSLFNSLWRYEPAPSPAGLKLLDTFLLQTGNIFQKKITIIIFKNRESQKTWKFWEDLATLKGSSWGKLGKGIMENQNWIRCSSIPNILR